MARFTKTVDIWELSPQQRAKLQPGQHVTAGPQGATGRYWGSKLESDVVAWRKNAKGRGWSYHRALRAYALGKS